MAKMPFNRTKIIKKSVLIQLTRGVAIGASYNAPRIKLQRQGADEGRNELLCEKSLTVHGESTNCSGDYMRGQAINTHRARDTPAHLSVYADGSIIPEATIIYC